MVRVKPWNWGSIPLYGTLPVTSDWEKWVKTPSRRNWEGHREGQLPQGLSLGWSAGQRLQLRSSQGPSHPSRREARLRADGLCVWGGHRRRQGEASEELTGTRSPRVFLMPCPQEQGWAFPGPQFSPLTEEGEYPS